jgi:glutathione S-transferase
MGHDQPSSFEAREVLAPQDDGTGYPKGISKNETHLLALLAVRPKSSHRRDRDRADRQNRTGADHRRAGAAQRRIRQHLSAKKLPALILDNGEVIVDSYVIVEYLDELAGGGKLVPTSGPTRWKVKSDHSLIQGMLDSMLLCRYEKMVRPAGLQWQAWSDDHWNRAWKGMAHFEKQPDMLSRPLDISQIALTCVLGYADFRFADCGWRKAYPKLDAFHQKMLERPSVKVSVPPPA